MIDDDIIENAIKRIAHTADGRLLHIGLQKALMAMCPTPADAGALYVFEGGRRFASRLKRMMDESIAETSSDGSGEQPAERPIVILNRGPVAVGGQRGTSRRGGIGNEPERKPE